MSNVFQLCWGMLAHSAESGSQSGSTSKLIEQSSRGVH
jgi:hypothetical protein